MDWIDHLNPDSELFAVQRSEDPWGFLCADVHCGLRGLGGEEGVSGIQDRHGPNRFGPFGLLQPLPTR